jgi:hypothetical protein
MSNKIHFEPTKFESVRTGSITYGCRVYDEGNATYTNATYTNTWDSIPDDDVDIIAKCLKNFSYRGAFNAPDDFSNMLEFIESEENGVFVGDIWYDWDEIKHLFAEK